MSAIKSRSSKNSNNSPASRARAFHVEPEGRLPDLQTANGLIVDRYLVEYITCTDAEIRKLHAAGLPVPKVSYTVGRYER